jgi:hypothetical protein
MNGVAVGLRGILEGWEVEATGVFAVSSESATLESTLGVSPDINISSNSSSSTVHQGIMFTNSL